MELVKKEVLVKTLFLAIICILFLSTSVKSFEETSTDTRWADTDFSDPNADLTGMGSQDMVNNWDALVENDRLGDSNLDQKALGDALRQQGYTGISEVNLAGSDASISGDVLSVGGNTIDLGSFGSGSHSIDASGDNLVVDGNEVVGADNVHLEDGVVTIDEVEFFSSDTVSIANGVNVRILEDGSVEADRAELIKLDNERFWGSVKQFSGKEQHFWVESAGVVNNGCLQAFNASDAEFSLEQSSTMMKVSSQTINVNDCGNLLSFSASQNASFTATKDPMQYLITNGNITFEDSEFIEWVQATQGALIIMDEYSGFSCMTIMPGGAYFYSSKADKRMDFSIESPPYGIDYRLCIKKDNSQTFTSFDGMIDLAGNNNILDGPVNYHRYPLRNKSLEGVVLEPVYQGFLNPKTRMRFDALNVFVTNITVISHPADRTVSKITVNNYISIKESPGSKDRNTRTWTKINPSLLKDELTDNLVLNYNGMRIDNNILIYENVRILAPEHGIIKTLLN